MKKTGIILAIVVLLVIGAYLFIRYYLLRSPDYKPDESKARSALDLRPALIAKLQQVVKDGSKGLYRLSLDSIEPHIANGSVDLVNARVTVDSAVLLSLDSLRLAPDDIYNISFRRLRIDGIGLEELLNRKHIDLKTIRIEKPEMILQRKERPYNATKRQARDTLTLYERITKHITHLSIGTIQVDSGTFISRNLTNRNKDTRFDQVSVQMQQILIDSTTQRDRNRFFFSENTLVSCGRLERRTADSLYRLEVDSLLLDAKAHRLTVFKLAFIPRGDQAYFAKKLKYRGDRFDIRTPKVVLSGMNWWQLFNKGTVQCSTLDILGGYLRDHVDGSMPPRPQIKVNNFPYQTLRNVSLPLNIQRVNIRNFYIRYSEYYPPSGRSGALYFDNVNARIDNLINTPENIQRGMWCRVDATTKFMHSIPGRLKMAFDMNRYREGVYTAEAYLGGFDGSVLNPVTEPLALFTVKRGVVDSCQVRIKGNNRSSASEVRLLYHDLHVSSLKKTDDNAFRKKSIMSFFMNALIIKNANPGNKDVPRQPYSTLERDSSPSFFNFAWRVMRFGILRTVGIPDKFIPK